MALTNLLPSATRADPARRHITILTAAQALGASGPPVIVSLGGMVGSLLADDKALSTLPVSLYHTGLALSTFPAALLMRRFGRQPVYLGGAAAMLCAGLIAAFGIVTGSFWLFCLGTCVAGMNGACVQSYRFAAVDLAGHDQRARAIGAVLLGGLVAGVLGPQLVLWTRDLVPGIPFAGAFISQSAMALLAIPVLAALPAGRARPNEPLVAGARGRPLGVIARNPRFIAAIVTGIVSQSMMSFLMTAAPLAMVECGHSVGDAALGIQWHVLAMFGPSFITGRLIQRFGELRIMAVGLVLIAMGAVVALSGLSVLNFWATLVLLGIGWNFGFIGATTTVAGCARPEERAKVQGFNDLLVFGSTATASLISGGILAHAGWFVLQWTVLPIVAVPLILLAVTPRAKTAIA